jgi:DNA repair exonuclease SbcCD nuclease subunit
MQTKVAAVCLSDLHLTENPPVARAEKEWFPVIDRYFMQIKKWLQKNATQEAPIIIAGDIFDKWNASSSLVNHIIVLWRAYFPLTSIYAIAGQHDLRYHDGTSITHTAYGTLALTTMQHLNPVIIARVNKEFFISGAFYNQLPGAHPSKPKDVKANLAVLHKYCWYKNYKHPEAAAKDSVQELASPLIARGYNCAIVGDNHKGFFYNKNPKIQIMNCGTFLRRKHDEQSYKPYLTILNKDGTFDQHYYDTSEDLFRDKKEIKKIATAGAVVNVKELINTLKSANDMTINFREELNQIIKKVDQDVKSLILEMADDAGL